MAYLRILLICALSDESIPPTFSDARYHAMLNTERGVRRRPGMGYIRIRRGLSPRQQRRSVAPMMRGATEIRILLFAADTMSLLAIDPVDIS
jgi:hypothetical protein